MRGARRRSSQRSYDPSPADLPPRQRQALACLLDGDGDKQIAARLGLTRNTINDYTKAIYRHFGVKGRAQLQARWIRRGDRRYAAVGAGVLVVIAVGALLALF